MEAALNEINEAVITGQRFIVPADFARQFGLAASNAAFRAANMDGSTERDRIAAWMREQASDCKAVAHAAMERRVSYLETKKVRWYEQVAACIDRGAHWLNRPEPNVTEHVTQADDGAYSAVCVDCGQSAIGATCLVEAFEAYNAILCCDCFDARNDEHPHPNSQFGAGA